MNKLTSFSRLSANRRAMVRLAWLWKQITTSAQPWIARELALEYETSTRTVDRDIEVLREMGAIETFIVKRNADPHSRMVGRVAVAHQCPFCGSRGQDDRQKEMGGPGRAAQR